MPRAAEIDYYEELGVPRNASPEQVREAFRALVRLLHPDYQTDDQLKKIADLQMRKLNRIYSVLSDAERRREYDETLARGDRAPTIVFSPQQRIAMSSRLLERTCWLAAVLILAGALVWLSSDSQPVVPAQTADLPSNAARPATGRPNNESAEEIARLQSDLRALKTERDAAFRELTRLRGPVAQSHPSGSAALPEAPPSVLRQQPPQSIIPEVPAPAPLNAPQFLKPVAQKQFAGFWFYTRPRQGQQNRNLALYPPEFIEASITEQNGTVKGRYRSRYQIADRAISPDVNFEFTGVANGTTLKCPFTGPGGARGELTMQLTAENAMNVEWATTELGSMQGLAAGTAKLTRRVDQ